jgi:DNA-directed RNA polymerase specialized sigma24 family protein
MILKFFYLILLEKPDEWFFTRKSMTASCIAIIRNQNKSTSPYRSLYKTYENGDSIVPDEIDDYTDSRILDEIGDYIDDEFYRQLKPDHWLQFKLHFYEGLKLKDVARKCNLNYQTIRLNILDLLKKLEDRMPEEIKSKYEQRIQKKRNQSS